MTKWLWPDRSAQRRSVAPALLTESQEEQPELEELPAPWNEVDAPLPLIPDLAPTGELGLTETCWEQPSPRLHLEVDEGLRIAVPVAGDNASRLLEQTHRLREVRERERAALRPIYDFGGFGERDW